jgi:molecular chaperone GrpE (heat shock protein)
MWKWFRTRRGEPAAARPTDDADLPALRREVQSQRLELAERERVLANLKSEMERLRRGEGERIAAAVQTQVERLLSSAAAPVAQLLTQAHLLEVEGKPVEARDVLAVARRLLRVLEDEGLALEGSVSATVAFDPNRHEPLSSATSLTAGQSAVIRFVGVAYRGKVLRKAGVAPGGE